MLRFIQLKLSPIKAQKRFNVYLMYILAYVVLLLFTSLNSLIMFITNLIFTSYILTFITKKKINKLNNYFMLFSVGNLVTFHLMVASYAELMPWEEGLHLVLYFISFYFYYNYSIGAVKSETVFDFKQISYFEKKM